MNDLDRMPFNVDVQETARTLVPSKRRCSHPKPRRISLPDGGWQCASCSVIVTPETMRRGRNNRARGNAIEREIGATMGLRRVGQFGGRADLENPLFVAQVKSGGWFSPREKAELDKLHATAGQTRLLIKASAPGGGHRRDVIVCLTLAELVELVGGDAIVSVSLSPDWLDRFGPERSEAA